MAREQSLWKLPGGYACHLADYLGGDGTHSAFQKEAHTCDKELAVFQACLLGFWQGRVLTQPLGSLRPPHQGLRLAFSTSGQDGGFPSFLSWQPCGLSLGWSVGEERLQGCLGDEVP